ncbi:unnamed protein product [Ceratitis capitata]|uniref:(Mediterranean fruit fly) hypothetical protein n=1 Tax=Ceratitis capitata TaxID=7213 RepID=A0A811V8X8_CERCA|nr:unnamed protein product [Ceratitis capitata]
MPDYGKSHNTHKSMRNMHNNDLHCAKSVKCTRHALFVLVVAINGIVVESVRLTLGINIRMFATIEQTIRNMFGVWVTEKGTSNGRIEPSIERLSISYPDAKVELLSGDIPICKFPSLK